MKQRFAWFPVFLILIVSTLFSGCMTQKKDMSSLLIGGAVVGVVGLITLLDGDGSDNSISIDDYEDDIKKCTFSDEGENKVRVNGKYKKIDFIDIVQSLKDVENLVLDLNGIKNMTEIPEKAFYECSNIKEVILPRQIESIGNYAFAGCKNLEQVNIPSNVSEIGEGAFRSCYELTKIELPKKITQIKYGTFSSCERLEDVSIPENVSFIGEDAFSYCESFISVVIPETVTTVENSAFYGCGMEKLTIKTDLKNVSEEAFLSCPNLKYIAIETKDKYDEEAFVDFLYSTKSIGSSDIVLDLANFEKMETFPKGKDNTSGNKYIAKVILPNNLKVIGEKAFQYWENLESVVIPKTITSIEPFAFFNCEKLTEVKIPEDIQVISMGSFASTAIKELEIPQNVRNIEEDAFKFCKNLETVTIKGDIETIGTNAFSECQNLKEITFKKTVKNIDEGAFSYCGFETFSAPKGLETIGSRAFAYCKDLRTLKNLENVKIINNDDNWDFIEECSNLEYLSVPSSVEIPEGWDPINIAGDLNYYNYKKLKFGVASDSPMFSTASNGEALLSKDGKALYAWPSASGTIKIPDTVEEISYNVFGNNESVESITLSKNITEIPHFNQCHNLKTLIIPEGITELLVPYGGAGTCEKLELLQIPSSLTVMGRKSSSDSPTIDQLSVPTFYSTNLKFNVAKNNQFFSTSKDGSMLLSKDGKILFAWPSASGDITIPDGIEEIADNALENTKIKKLTIGEHVKKIGELAFSRSEVVSLEIYSNNTEFMTGIFFGCSNLERVSITGQVNTISHYMFQECSKLCDVSIPSLKRIDVAAFMDCIALTRFVIPENLEDIGEEAFWNCKNLNFFDVSKSKNFKTTNNGTTLLSKDGEIMYFWAGVSGSVIIPEGVKKLNTEVFSAKSGPITSVTLPKSLEDLGGTFDICALSLYPDNPVINFCGTEEEWQDLKATAGYWAEKDLDESTVICNYKY